MAPEKRAARIPPARSARQPRRRRALRVCACLLAFGAGARAAEHAGVSTTLHNLSASGPGEVRSLVEDEVCKFCHIPHNAESPTQLWSRELPRSEYTMSVPASGGGAWKSAPQPDGSSRLCLSCHDGTVALGKISGEPRIAMTGATRINPGRRGFIGTDLSGSHPISFEVPDGGHRRSDDDSDMRLRPLAEIQQSASVRLDADGKMQCTTCHDPHADRYYEVDRVPRFWVRPTVEEVCLACHELR